MSLLNGKILLTYAFRLMGELLDTDSKRLGAQLRGELTELTESTEMTEIFGNPIKSGYRSVH